MLCFPRTIRFPFVMYIGMLRLLGTHQYKGFTCLVIPTLLVIHSVAIYICKYESNRAPFIEYKILYFRTKQVKSLARTMQLYRERVFFYVFLFFPYSLQIYVHITKIDYKNPAIDF